jgi:drug/metabolite transporter, DME family
MCVLAASVLWGTTGTAATFAPAVGPVAIGAAAMGLGGLLQALTAARPMRRHRVALRAEWRMVLVGGTAVGLYPLAFYTSMRLAGVAVGTVVSIGSAPLAAALAERVIDHRRLTARWMLGAALGLAGIAALCLAEATRPSPGREALWPIMLGVGLGLGAGMAYAIYSWAAHRLIGRGLPPRAAMGAVFGLGGLVLLPVLLATGSALASWPNAAVGAYMAVVPMFTGYLMFGWALARVPASTATTLSLLEPAIATILAVAVVGERLPAAGWAGLTLIAACLITIATPPEPLLSARQPLVDELLRAEDDSECEPFGVLGARLGRVNHDPQVVAGDDEGVAVECDEPDAGMVDDLVPGLIVGRADLARLPQLGEARAVPG